MKLEDVVCPCGEPVEPVQDDLGVFLRCRARCPLVSATPAPNVMAAIEEWQAALPIPSIETALEAYAYNSASALAYAQTPPELVALAPLAQVLISFLQFQSHRPAGDDSK
ncbi:hypothetical protein LCGC14_0258280 [marine sediment metagenome]|uniref:Uncharacterized protein n=1 Tax=marine sediment metagenome TaxID=412755 RepID=A0A0F9X735_9ZZZZ